MSLPPAYFEPCLLAHSTSEFAVARSSSDPRVLIVVGHGAPVGGAITCAARRAGCPPALKISNISNTVTLLFRKTLSTNDARHCGGTTLCGAHAGRSAAGDGWVCSMLSDNVYLSPGFRSAFIARACTLDGPSQIWWLDSHL